MNHDEEYNNAVEPEEQDMPWFDQNEDGAEGAVAVWTDAFFGTIYDMVRSVQFGVNGIESFVNAAEFTNKWMQGNYFQSGYFLGAGIFNTIFLWVDTFNTYVDNLIY